MSMVERIIGFMARLAEHSVILRQELQDLRQELQQERIHMAATLQSLKDKLAQQGEYIEQLAAQKTASEQADLDAIDAAVDENTAKLAAVLQPAGQQPV